MASIWPKIWKLGKQVLWHRLICFNNTDSETNYVLQPWLSENKIIAIKIVGKKANDR